MADRITANLPMRSNDATVAFYRLLGFEVAYRDDSWLILERGSLELEFFAVADLDPATSSFSACVRVADVDGLWAEWSGLGLPVSGIPRLHGPPGALGWPLRGFALVDPDGSLLRVLEE
jgi:catechol 2,3-dioxygenase-like lactoylglutathione lyase family enzyme